MTAQPPSALTINVFKAYLNPLLKKHESGKVIVYEDLLASWEAVQAVLSKHESAPDASDVKEKIKALHNEQVLEYKKAGKRALVEYCRTCSLPAGDSSDPNHTLKCIRHALNGIPNWKLPRPLERLTSSPTPSSPTKPPAPTPTSPKPLAIKPSAKVVPKQNEPAVASIVEEGEEVETPAEEAAPASADEGEMEEGEEAEEEEDEKAEEEEAEEEAADEDNTEKKGNAGKTKGLLAKRRALGKTAAPKRKEPPPKVDASGHVDEWYDVEAEVVARRRSFLVTSSSNYQLRH